MSAALPDQIRRVIPRWRDFRTASALGELASPSATPNRAFFNELHFEQRISVWRSSPNVAVAAELVAIALVLGRQTDVADAASFLLTKGSSATAAVRDIAHHVLFGAHTPHLGEPDDPSSGQLRAAVRAFRSRLNASSRSPFPWADLARVYSLLGQRDKSLGAMTVALRLAPTNRFVLRCAARLYVHADRPDEAHDVLRRSPATRHDPWLMSAEIAVASVAERSSSLARLARRELEADKYPARHATELASAVATQELFAGDHRRARQLFEKSLVSPTENAVAQAEWASQEVPGIVVEDHKLNVPRSFEASALKAFHAAEWQSGLRSCERWLWDEAFSKRPAVMASYFASVALEDFGLAETFARRGLLANPGDPLLTNNLVVALANQGFLDQATRVFDSIDRSAAEESLAATLLATQGLLRFRAGDRESGIRLYYESIQSPRGRSDPKFRALALGHLAREAVRARLAQAEERLRAAEAECRADWPEVRAMLENLRRATHSIHGSTRDRSRTRDLFERIDIKATNDPAPLIHLRRALVDRDWLVEQAALTPLSINAVFHHGVTFDMLAEHSASPDVISLNVTTLLNDAVDTGDVAFVGLYPSGAVRGIGAELLRQADELTLVVKTPLAFVDPEAPEAVSSPSSLHCQLTLFGVRYPSYGR